MKKILKITFSLLFVLIVTLVSIPYFFKDDIERIIKEEINNSVNAKIDYQNVSLSLLKDFPNLHVSIDQISVIGIDEFKDLPLAKIDQFTMSLNAKRLFINSDLEIKKIGIDGADIHIKVLKNGKANYDIAKASNETEQQPEKNYEIKIKDYHFNNSNITYDDASMNFHMKMLGINHEGTGKFTKENYLLDTQTTAENFDVLFDDIHYINKAKTTIDMKMLIEDEFSKYTMKDISMKLNDLALNADVMIKMAGDAIDMDIKYQTKENQLVKLLSLVPKQYMPDLQGMKTNGTANLSGFVKGTYLNDVLPAFGVDFSIKNGFVKYPDLPESIKNINAITKINFPGGKSLDKMSINLPKIHFSIADSNFDGRLKIDTPMSDPLIDTKFTGKMDLAKIKKAVYLPEIKKLEGVLDADVTLKGKTSAIEKQQYNKFKAEGYFKLDNMQYVSDSLPYPVAISKAEMTISPQAMQLKQFASTVGESDFNIKGKIHNYISYFVKKDKVLKADFSMHSNYLNMNEFMTEDSGSTNDSVQTAMIRIPKNLDIKLKADADKVKYEDMNLNDVKSIITVKDEKAELSTVLMKTLGGQLQLKGAYDTSNKLAKSSLNMQMQKMSISESANTFSSFNSFAPVLKKVNGNFFSNMTMNVDLDNQMNPILNTMDAAGDFNTNNIQVGGIDVLKKIANLVKMPELSKATVDQIKAQFEIQKGKMTVKPFDFKLNNMSAKLGGNVGLDQKIHFDLAIDIPKEKLGSKATSIIEGLIGKLDKLGLSASLPDIIKMKFNISGNYDNPIIKPVIAGYEGKTTKDIVTQVVTDKITEAVDDGKEKARAEAQAKADELLKKAQEQSDKLVATAKEQGDKMVEEAKKMGDKLKDEAKKQGEDLVKKAGENVFKKMAAQKLAENLKKEANKKALKLESESQNKRKQLIDHAKQQGASIIASAKQKGDKMIQKIK